MNDLLALFREFTPGAYGVWTGVLMFAGWWLREWRETRKLTAADRLARREGYAKQVENLQVENRNLRADLVAAEERHDHYRHACQRETDQLREQIRGLEDEVAGLKRRVDGSASSTGRVVIDGANAPVATAKFKEGQA